MLAMFVHKITLYSLISNIYMAPLLENYSETLNVMYRITSRWSIILWTFSTLDQGLWSPMRETQ